MTRSWGRILLLTVLALSLVLNFFLAGFIAKGIGDGLGGMVARRIANAYPEEFRTAFRAAMRESRPQTFGALRDLRAAHLALADAVSARPRDDAAVKAAEAEVTHATDALQALMREYFDEALEKTKAP